MSNPACCAVDGDCDDGNACTFDVCLPDETCKHVTVAGTGCCTKDADCPDLDGDPCTSATCEGGQCSAESAVGGCVPAVVGATPLGPDADTPWSPAGASCWQTATAGDLGPDEYAVCDAAVGQVGVVNGGPTVDPAAQTLSVQLELEWAAPAGAHSLSVLATNVPGDFGVAAVVGVVNLADAGRAVRTFELPAGMTVQPQLQLGVRVDSDNAVAPLRVAVDDVLVGPGRAPFFVAMLRSDLSYDRVADAKASPAAVAGSLGQSLQALLYAHDPDAADGLSFELLGAPDFVSLTQTLPLPGFGATQARLVVSPTLSSHVGPFSATLRVGDGTFSADLELAGSVTDGGGLVLGQACGDGAACSSGHCVDGFCCDSVCGATCFACDLPAHQGSCRPLPAGADEPACAPFGCSAGGSCASVCVEHGDCAAGHYCDDGGCAIDGDDCAGAPCGQGTCTDGPGSFTCACPTGTFGATCTPCDCIGIGSLGPGCDGSGVCACRPGYTGTKCEIDIDECALDDPCLHGGTCVDEIGGSACLCVQGYGGPTCAEPVDCGSVQDPERGAWACDGSTLGAQCMAVCDAGSHPAGGAPTTIICQANGLWETVELGAVCPVDGCAAPTAPSGGTYSCADVLSSGATCSLACPDGFTAEPLALVCELSAGCNLLSDLQLVAPTGSPAGSHSLLTTTPEVGAAGGVSLYALLGPTPDPSAAVLLATDGWSPAGPGVEMTLVFYARGYAATGTIGALIEVFDGTGWVATSVPLGELYELHYVTTTFSAGAGPIQVRIPVAPGASFSLHSPRLFDLSSPCVAWSSDPAAAACADVDECADSPCLNGGTCANSLGSFACSCLLGFEGDTCEIEVPTCDEPAAQANGRWACADDLSACHLVCDPGFVRATGVPESVTCSATGTWIGGLPPAGSCVADACGAPGAPVGGSVNCEEGLDLGDACALFCDGLLELADGEPTDVTCVADACNRAADPAGIYSPAAGASLVTAPIVAGSADARVIVDAVATGAAVGGTLYFDAGAGATPLALGRLGAASGALVSIATVPAGATSLTFSSVPTAGPGGSWTLTALRVVPVDGSCAAWSTDPTTLTCQDHLPCAPNPCVNGGTCSVSAVAPNGYQCGCPAGFWGPRCESACAVQGHCVQVDVCHPLTGAPVACTGCAAGFTGPTCSLECIEQTCDGPVTCSQADATDVTCTACVPGFWGPGCDQACVSPNCAAVPTCDFADGGNVVCSACDQGYEGGGCDQIIIDDPPYVPPTSSYQICAPHLGNDCPAGEECSGYEWTGVDAAVPYGLSYAYYRGTIADHFCYGPRSKEVGERCVHPRECRSNVCDPETRECRCSDDAECPAGEVCSSYTKGLGPFATFVPGICLGPDAGSEPPGSSCVNHLECTGGCYTDDHKCGCFEDSHCPAGQFCDFFDRICLLRRDPGVPCSENSHCKSNECYGLCGGCGAGGCDLSIPPGSAGQIETCYVNGDCASGLCVGGYCGCSHDGHCDDGFACDPGDQWCVGAERLLGWECATDSMCETGICREGKCSDCRSNADCPAGAACGEGRHGHTCYVPQAQPNWATCDHDDQCIAGYCELDFNKGCACEEKADCPAGTFCHSLGFLADLDQFALLQGVLVGLLGVPADEIIDDRCYPLLPVDEACALDEVCVTGHCHDIEFRCVNCLADTDCGPGQRCSGSTLEASDAWECFTAGVKGYGEACVHNDECTTGSCTNQICDCDTDATCGPGEFCDAFGNCLGHFPVGIPCLTDNYCATQACEDAICQDCDDDEDCVRQGLGSRCSGSIFEASDAWECFDPATAVYLGTCVHNDECISGSCTNEQCDCTADHDCASGFYCDTFSGYCLEKGAHGAGCLADNRCLSSACEDGYCQNCDDDGDCVVQGLGTRCSGSILEASDAWECYTPATKAYLGACVHNEECTSGSCTNQQCDCVVDGDCPDPANRYCDTFTGYCLDRGDVGDGCLADNRCKSNACEDGYCQNCDDDGDCVAQGLGTKCSGSILEASDAWECYTPATRGYDEACVHNAECVSGSCTNQRCDCVSDAGCSSTQWCRLLTGNCIDKFAEGHACVGDYECLTDACEDLVCQTCDDDGDCTRQALGTKCSGSILVASDAWECYTPATRGYNEVCVHNAQCVSGSCTNQRCDCVNDAGCPSTAWCQLATGNCIAKFAEGHACIGDYECLTDACEDLTCQTCDDNGDCTRQGLGSHWSGSIFQASDAWECYTPNTRSYNQSCVHDAQCTTGWCTGQRCRCQSNGHCSSSQYCGDDGYCKAKKAVGGWCDVDYVCQSNACVPFSCVECESDGQCAGSKRCSAWNDLTASLLQGGNVVAGVRWEEGGFSFGPSDQVGVEDSPLVVGLGNLTAFGGGTFTVPPVTGSLCIDAAGGWVGAKRVGGAWQWGGGAPVDEALWAAGEPSDLGLCARWNPDGSATLIAEPCGDDSYTPFYTCEFETSPCDAACSGARCDDGRATCPLEPTCLLVSLVESEGALTCACAEFVVRPERSRRGRPALLRPRTARRCPPRAAPYRCRRSLRRPSSVVR